MNTLVHNISKAKKSNATEREIALVYTVTSEEWAKYLLNKAKANSLKNTVETQKLSFGFTPKDEFVLQYGLGPMDKATIPIVNGNGAQLGKVTYYWQDEKVIPAGWAMRIS